MTAVQHGSGTSAAPSAEQLGRDRRGDTLTRWLLYAAGTGMAVYGLQGVLRDPGSDPVRWAGWLIGGALAHDLLLVPVVLMAGRVLRLLPARLRAPVQAALLVGAVLTLVAVPFLGRFGVKPGNASHLPRDYTAGLLVALAVVAVVTTLVTVVVRLVRRRGAGGR